MKRISVVLGLALLACGCEPPEPPNNVTTFAPLNAPYYQSRAYSVVIVDGCEYLFRNLGGGDAETVEFTHRGNCKACRQWMMDAIHAKAEKPQ